MSITAAVYGKKLEEIRDRLKKLSTSLETDDKQAFIQLEKDLEDLSQREYLTIAFIGEYSAGKSTLISALTGRRDLKISADIATDECREYEWNGIRLIDTPGLGTERQDHDERTYEAIKKADLLVYCLTYSLFDTLTLENFKKLAFEQNYQTKMMLLVNKMSAEAGDVEERIGYYTESLKKSLEPDDLSQFPLVFCDARDQLEGEDEQFEELKKLSRFEFLTQELNKFVEERNITARLQTPLDLIVKYLNNIIDKSSDDLKNDGEKFVLKKLEETVGESESHLRDKLRGKVVDFRNKIIAEAEALVDKFDEDDKNDEIKDKIEKGIKEIEQNIKDDAEKLNNTFQKDIQEAVEALNKELEKQLNAPLVKRLIDLEKVSIDDVEIPDGAGGFFRDLEKLKKVFGPLTELIDSSRLVDFLSKKLPFLKSVVNFDKAIPVIGTVGSVIIGEFAERLEVKKGADIRRVKRDIVNQLTNVAKKAEKESEKATSQALKEIYQQVEDIIFKMRKSYEDRCEACDETKRQAIALRDECKVLSKSL
ncbi:MAG: 50S ribosome-binding GTPase [Acetobacter sp.]|nr:50S ribosome-binding GTPase [Acetobacter sp.]